MFLFRRAKFLGQRRTESGQREGRDRKAAQATLASSRLCLEVLLMGNFYLVTPTN